MKKFVDGGKTLTLMASIACGAMAAVYPQARQLLADEGYYVNPSEPTEAVEITAEPFASIAQLVDTPNSPFLFSFDYAFASGNGYLDILLDGYLLGTLSATGVPETVFTGFPIIVDDPLLGLKDIVLEFVLFGGNGPVLYLDNIVFPGVENGDFETGDLTGWTPVPSTAPRVVSLTPLAVPEPAALGLLLLSLPMMLALVRGRRRRG